MDHVVEEEGEGGERGERGERGEGRRRWEVIGEERGVERGGSEEDEELHLESTPSKGIYIVTTYSVHCT